MKIADSFRQKLTKFASSDDCVSAFSISFNEKLAIHLPSVAIGSAASIPPILAYYMARKSHEKELTSARHNAFGAGMAASEPFASSPELLSILNRAGVHQTPKEDTTIQLPPFDSGVPQ